MIQTFFPGQDTGSAEIPDGAVPPDDSTIVTALDSFANDRTRVAHPVPKASSVRASPEVRALGT